MANLEGVGPDVKVVYNEKGAGQSHSPYRFDLYPPMAAASVAKMLAHGAEKYGEGSYLNIDAKDHLNHALQRIFAFTAGDTQECPVIEHARHAVCRAVFWLECLERSVPNETVVPVGVAGRIMHNEFCSAKQAINERLSRRIDRVLDSLIDMTHAEQDIVITAVRKAYGL